MAAPPKYQKVNDIESDEDSYADNMPSILKASQDAYPSRDLGQKAWFRRPSVFWLLPVFLLFSMGMGATAMPKTNVLISLLCRNILSSQALLNKTTQHTRRHDGASMDGMSPNNTASPIIIGDHNAQCSIQEVESATAMFTLYGNLIAGILGAIANPIWGSLSDKYGRVRPLAAASTVVLGSEIVMVLIAKLPDAISVNWGYIVYFLEGLSGTFILIMALASSYAADCTNDSERNIAFGWFHGSMFFGMATGPVLGGYIGMIGGKSRPMLILYTALIMRVVGIIYLLVLVPESHLHRQKLTGPAIMKTKEYIAKVSHQTWIEKVQSANPLQILSSNSTTDKDVRRNLLALACVNTIMFGAFMGAMSVMMLYSEFTFGWGNKESGIFLSIVNFFRTLASALVLPLAIHFLRRFFYPSRLPSSRNPTRGFDRLDLFLIRISILSDIVGYVGYATSPTGALFTLSGAVAALGAIGLATSEASMTKLVGSAQTGELLGALGFLQAMARVVVPTVATFTYSRTVARVPQLAFWGLAACFVAAGVSTFGARLDGNVGSDESEDAVLLQAWED